MRTSRAHRKHRTRLQQTLCCSCRLSVSSSEEAESAATSERFPSISSLAHAMVQERLDQMIRERREAAKKLERRRQRVLQLAEDQKCCCTSSGGTKFVVMVAMEKRSYDPREDFRDSMAEMITANKIEDPKDLRCLLNYYLSMNSEEYQGMILEVFHDVCTRLFLCCKCH